MPGSQWVIRVLVLALPQCGVSGVEGAQRPRVTFTRDVAPLLYRHCIVCHRPGGAAQVSFLDYANTRPHARQIAIMTAARTMPPWLPESGSGTFKGDRRLSADDIAVFAQWVRDGVEEGDRREVPSPPVWPSDWELGTPDLVLTMPAFALRADGRDLFRNFVIPVPGDTPRFVRAWEFRPGNPRVVHHATMQVDASGASRRLDANDPGSGYEGVIAPSARAPDGFFLDWAPGHRPAEAMPGTSWPLPPASDLVMMLHLRPSGRVEQVQASIALYFAERPPERVPVMLRLTRQDLDFAPGTTRHLIADSYVAPVDVDLITVQPHAHYLAREFSASATLPDGRAVALLKISNWDFNWQDVYQYVEPVRLPAGTTLNMAIAYDNSSGNPRNPNNPPRRVSYGQQTDDEMAEMWFQALPVRGGDRERLVKSVYDKVLPAEIVGRRRMLERDPSNAVLHDDLGLMLAEVGDLAASEREFRQTLQLQPDSAPARFNVGMSLLARGDERAAVTYFESALAADAAHAGAHFQLGLLAQRDGRLAAAADHLDRALAGKPADPEMLLSAGVIDAWRGDPASAQRRLREALRLRPGWQNAEAALALVLATSPGATDDERTQAVRLAERANERTGRRNPRFLDILASTYASVGNVRRALDVEVEALRLAQEGGDAALTEEIRRRVDAFNRQLGGQVPTPDRQH
jgi:Flp pilus assembly protein TadD